MRTVPLGLCLSPSSSPSPSSSSISTKAPPCHIKTLSFSPSRVRVCRIDGNSREKFHPFSPGGIPGGSGVCRASQAVDLFPSIWPEIVIRDARLEDCWEVADTHCSSFFPDYTFPVDLVLRIDRFVALLSGFSVPPGCMRTCLVAVSGSSGNELYIGSEDFKVGGFEGKFSFNRGSVAGILTIDTVADFLPRKGPFRQRRYCFGGETSHPRMFSSEVNVSDRSVRGPENSNRQMSRGADDSAEPPPTLKTGIAYISNVAVRESDRRKGIAKMLLAKAEARARSWGCRSIALHCDSNNLAAVRLYKCQGYKIIKLPKQAKWPHPKISPGVQFDFMMKLISPGGTT